MITFSGAALSEMVYLRSPDPCLVPAYTAPGGKPLADKLQCEEQVTILEREGSYLRIRTADNRSVWVDDSSTTDALPAELEVERLQEYQKKIEAEIAVLNDQVNRLSSQSEKLLEALLATQASKVKNRLLSSKFFSMEPGLLLGADIILMRNI